MKLRKLICIAAAGMCFAAPAAANDRDPFDRFQSAFSPETLFRGVIREDDVSLLFQHIRESIAASARGEEPKESDAMVQRREAIAREMAVRGSVLVGALLNAFEAAARQVVREEFGNGAPPWRSSPFPIPSID